MSKPRCEDIGFEHAWRYITSPISYPPYPQLGLRKCINCGRKEAERVVQPEIRKWQEVPPDANG